MSLSKERSLVGFVLVVTSFLLYVVHYFVFHNTHDILFYLLFNLAFIPINVLVVTLIIDKLLSERERRDRMEKLNMVIGVFFSEVGTPLLIYLSDSDPNLETMRKDLIVTADWTETEFGRISDLLKKYPFKTNIQLINLENLGSFLGKEKNFLLRLLENPLLLEHETFTELLRAVFHLTEELVYRNNL
ncbi:MAG: hypothetical protein NTX88_08695, partial [Candidatus Atribacteria bacterium]|nr:hypothetical protein [Candidatus Atribacteria bacterium]